MESEKHSVAPILRQGPSERLTEILQGATSAVDLLAPGFGSLFGLAATYLIPNQRQERLAEYATGLSRRLRVTQGTVEELQRQLADLAAHWSAEKMALFEDGAYVVQRATNRERIEQVTKVVADGLNDDKASDEDTRQARRILGFLAQIDAFELRLLRLLAQSPGPQPNLGANSHDHHKAFIDAELPRLLSEAGAGEQSFPSALARLRSVGAIVSSTFGLAEQPVASHYITDVGRAIVDAIDEPSRAA